MNVVFFDAGYQYEWIAKDICPTTVNIINSIRNEPQNDSLVEEPHRPSNAQSSCGESDGIISPPLKDSVDE